ncbi:MAG: type IV toxin-antitoxin system AbiEi family antitoxin domain-containing protein [Acidimicrobiia bacterium]|nr:type IV toxin-antitoxin system AbiEi family antitoxin domain-containing protein [Acidimicrobiia bacterium]
MSTAVRLGQVAEDQWGLITRRQAEDIANIPPATFARLAADGSVLERVAHGVYRMVGAPMPDHLDLRAAWLQLAPATPAWARTPSQGVVSHRSAAELHSIGHLPADRHDFTLPGRRQSRRSDVRLHRRPVSDGEWGDVRGLPVTRPSRIASDLLYDSEDPGAVAHLIADAIRAGYDHPAAFVESLGPHAARFGLRRGDGLALLSWLLDLVGDPDAPKWVDQAATGSARASGPEAHSSTGGRGE